MEITCISINEHNESLTDKKINVKYLLPKEKANISDLKQFIIHEKGLSLPL
jgi:hypothetical protein